MSSDNGAGIESGGTPFWPGYCQLCREKEVELYGEVLDWDEVDDCVEKHERACREAGCRHPANVWDLSGDDELRAPGCLRGMPFEMDFTTRHFRPCRSMQELIELLQGVVDYLKAMEAKGVVLCQSGGNDYYVLGTDDYWVAEDFFPELGEELEVAGDDEGIEGDEDEADDDDDDDGDED
jgi:hypothetical protein